MGQGGINRVRIYAFSEIAWGKFLSASGSPILPHRLLWRRQWLLGRRVAFVSELASTVFLLKVIAKQWLIGARLDMKLRLRTALSWFRILDTCCPLARSSSLSFCRREANVTTHCIARYVLNSGPLRDSSILCKDVRIQLGGSGGL